MLARMTSFTELKEVFRFSAVTVLRMTETSLRTSVTLDQEAQASTLIRMDDELHVIAECVICP